MEKSEGQEKQREAEPSGMRPPAARRPLNTQTDEHEAAIRSGEGNQQVVAQETQRQGAKCVVEPGAQMVAGKGGKLATSAGTASNEDEPEASTKVLEQLPRTARRISIASDEQVEDRPMNFREERPIAGCRTISQMDDHVEQASRKAAKKLKRKGAKEKWLQRQTAQKKETHDSRGGSEEETGAAIDPALKANEETSEEANRYTIAPPLSPLRESEYEWDAPAEGGKGDTRSEQPSEDDSEESHEDEGVSAQVGQQSEDDLEKRYRYMAPKEREALRVSYVVKVRLTRKIQQEITKRADTTPPQKLDGAMTSRVRDVLREPTYAYGAEAMECYETAQHDCATGKITRGRFDEIVEAILLGFSDDLNEYRGLIALLDE
jgi:hypothetical protein